MDTTRLLQLAGAMTPSVGDDPADTELLRRYTAERDEGAFAELVRRNGPLVLRTCRHVLGDAGAEDAFQASFLLLVRSAGRLTRSGSLAGWLHATAVRIAHRARRGEQRRRKREIASDTKPTAPDDLTWREVREALDHELAALPEKYRVPLVLCYLQEVSYEEAARRVGCPVGALRGRLERGKELLRKRLAKYGLPLAAPVLVLGPLASVSPALAEVTLGTVRAALSGGPVPLVVAGLAGRPPVFRVALLAPVVVVLAAVGAVLAEGTRHPDFPPQTDSPPPVVAPSGVGDKPAQQLDPFGDPLPPGALARLGSARFHHGDHVGRVIVGADGKLVASEAGYRNYKLWTGDTGKPVALWDGLTKSDREPVRFTLASASGRLAAIVWDANGSRLLDPVSGEVIKALPPINPGSPVELAPDGKTVATLRRDFKVGKAESVFRIWNADKDRWTDLDDAPGQPTMRAILFSADSKRVAYCANDGAVRVWDVASAKSVLQLPATAQQFMESVALSPDGKLLAREDQKTTKIRIWDVDAGKERPELADQPEKLGQALAFAPDGKTLVGIVHPNTIRLWDVTARKKLRDIRAHNYQVFHLAFTDDGKRLYAADGNGVSVWDPATGKPLDDVGGHRYAIDDAAWAPDGTRLASGAAYTDNIARVWNPTTGRKVFDLVGHESGIERVAYSPDGALLATGSQDGTVRLWNPATGKEVHTFAAKDGMVYALAFSPDGRWLMTGGRTALHVWDVAGRKEARSIPYKSNLVLLIAFLRDGKRVLVGDYEAGVRIIDFANGQEIARLAAKWSRAVVSPDDRYVALTNEDGSVRLSDASTGREIRVLVGPVTKDPDGKNALGLAFSPDGRTVAAAYQLGEVRVYEVATGSERFRFAGHTGAPLGVRFSPDGSRLCSFAGDKTLLIWDVTGSRLAPAPVPKNADAAWADLMSPDAAKGFAAMRFLGTDPAAGVPFLAARVKPVAVPDPKVIGGLIEKLSSADFGDREAASKELVALAPGAAVQLREAARTAELPEVRARLATILAGTGSTRFVGEPLRATRAVEVLERIGSPEARKVLTRVAGGAPGADLTRDAAAALGRRKGEK